MADAGRRAMSRHRPRFIHDYMPQPSVVGPDLCGWTLGELRNFEPSTGYGFVRNERQQDVLLHSATRVMPRRNRDDRTLNVIVTLNQQCDWIVASMPVNGESLYYKYWPTQGKLRASAWCTLADIDGVDKSLDEQQYSYSKLPFFTLAIEDSTGNTHKFYRTNRPFRTLQKWLYTRNYINTRDEFIVCFVETKEEGTLRYSEYDALRQAIARLPPDIKGL